MTGYATIFWNYRIIKKESEGIGIGTYGIHEVFYNEDGKPVAYTKDPVAVEWDEDDDWLEGEHILNRMLEAFNDPVLTHDDFPNNDGGLK